MSSKMREALHSAVVTGLHADAKTVSKAYAYAVANEIAFRYGDLEFTREEVEIMLSIGQVLPRHLGESSDETPTIKASEIEALTGEKVPGWAKYASKDQDDLVMVHDCLPEKVYPKNSYHRWMAKGGCTRDMAEAGEKLLPGPWDQSLRRIVHDEPEKTAAQECERLDREVGELSGELIALTKRVAAIKTRVLADGHAKSCEWVEAVLWKESTDVDVECTCGHDEIRENSK